MAVISQPNSVSEIASDPKANYTTPLIIVTALFFMWGFITCLNDILIPHLKAAFNLTFVQAMLIQFTFFGAYFIMSLPAGKIISKIGYKSGIILGLVIAGIGCALFYPAAEIKVYGLFLAALFILATGITLLQVAANPYVTILGSPKTASSRLNLTQAFNSLGTTIAPWFGKVLILSGAGVVAAAHSADSVKLPYLGLAATLFLLAILIKFSNLPVLNQSAGGSGEAKGTFKGALSHTHLLLGVLCIFMYVGGEVAIGSFLINFFELPNVAGLTESEASDYVSYYWGLAMIGRFIGAAVLSKLNPGKALGASALVVILLLIAAIIGEGAVAMWSVIFIGLFNSIMFPTIFTLAIKSLGVDTGNGSSLLVMAIVGGAIIPLMQGGLADSVGVQMAFILPLLCYVYICFYGFVGSKVKSQKAI